MSFSRLLSLAGYVLSSPLLATSVALASLGMCWGTVELCWRYPWLVLLATSWVCLLGHCFLAIRGQGLVGHLPAVVSDALGRPVFELVRFVAVHGVLIGVDTVRLLLLAIGDLDEEQRAQVLEELSEDYRHECFQKPSLALLPRWLQYILLGSKASALRKNTSRKSASEESKLPKLDLDSHIVSNDGGMNLAEGATPCRQTSKDSVSSAAALGHVSDLLQQLRSAETVARSIEIPNLQKVLHEKISDYTVSYTVAALRNGGNRRVQTTRKAVNDIVSKAKTHELSRAASKLVSNPSPHLEPITWSGACSLAWAMIAFPWRATYATISVSIQGVYLVTFSALDLAHDAVCSCSRRKHSELRWRWNNDVKEMLATKLPVEHRSSEAIKQGNDGVSGSESSD